MKKFFKQVLILLIISILSLPLTYAQEEIEIKENPIVLKNDKLSYEMELFDTEIIHYTIDSEEEYEVKIKVEPKKIIKVKEDKNEISVNAIKAGKATLIILVEFEDESFYEELKFTVNKEEEKASIKFNDKTQKVNRGDNFVIDFEVTPKNLDLARIIWESSDPDIASVENGSVYGNRVGNVSITASIDGEKASMDVTVIAPLEKIEFNPNLITLGLNETVAIPEIIYVPYDTTVDRSVTYSVVDEEILSISNNKIVGLKSGKTEIIAKVNSVEAVLMVEVAEQTLASDAHTLLLENTEIDEEGFHLKIRDFQSLEKDKYELYLPKQEILKYMENRELTRLIIHLEKELADDNLKNMSRLAIDKDILLQLGAQKLEIIFKYDNNDLYKFNFNDRHKETYYLSFNFEKIRPDNPVYKIVKNDHSYEVNFDEPPIEGMSFSIHENVLNLQEDQIFFLYGFENDKVIDVEENFKSDELGYLNLKINYPNNILSLSPISQTNNILVMIVLIFIIILMVGYGFYQKHFKLRKRKLL